MSKRLILMFALVLGIGLIATAAYAEVQSIKVSGDLTTIALNRVGFNMCDISAQDDTGVIAMTRVRFDADLTDGVGVTVRLLDERDWEFAQEAASSSDIDLDLAYVTLNEFLYSPLTLMVGRQELRLGSGLIIGDPDTNQTDNAVAAMGLPAGTRDLSLRKAFDGMVGILDYDPIVITLGYLKDTEASTNGTWADERDDVTVYLANLAYDFQDDMSTSAELYYVYQDNQTNAPGENDVDDARNLGVRVVSTPLDALTATAEYCYQTVNRGASMTGQANDKAVLVSLAYDLEDDLWIDTIGVDYTRLGEDWAVMYEDQTPADIANAAFSNTNMEIIGVTATAKPREDLTVRLRFANFQLLKNDNNIAETNYSFREDIGRSKDLGNEVDLHIVYDYTEDVQLGLSLAYFDPDNYFQSPTSEATQILGSMKVSF